MAGYLLGRNLPVDDPIPNYAERAQQVNKIAPLKKPVDLWDCPMTFSERCRQARSSQENIMKQRITRFITKYLEPLMVTQASSGVSKTLYIFLPSDMDARCFEDNFKPGELKVEGFGGCETSVGLIRRLGTQEFVKLVRLVGDEFKNKFWSDSVFKELEKTFKARLVANGEKIASADACWCGKSFCKGETLTPGHTGICVHRMESSIIGNYGDFSAFYICVEIT